MILGFLPSFPTTVAGFHRPSGSLIRTLSPSATGAKALAFLSKCFFCCSCLCFLSAQASMGSWTFGCSCLYVVGSTERGRRLIKSCAGDAMLSTGVFLYSKMLRYGSRPSRLAMSIRRFALCTNFSARPFDWGYLGLDVVCLESHSAANLANSIDEYCGPLSDTTSPGIPCLANIVFNFRE